MIDGVLRLPKDVGSDPRATAGALDPLLPWKAFAASWQDAQETPAGRERVASSKTRLPRSSSRVRLRSSDATTPAGVACAQSVAPSNKKPAQSAARVALLERYRVTGIHPPEEEKRVSHGFGI